MATSTVLQGQHDVLGLDLEGGRGSRLHPDGRCEIAAGAKVQRTIVDEDASLPTPMGASSQIGSKTSGASPACTTPNARTVST